MSLKDLATALHGQPQSPCEKFACTQWNACRDEKLACDAFRYYVQANYGTAYHPASIIPIRAWRRGEPDRGEIKPTRENYIAMGEDLKEEVEA